MTQSSTHTSPLSPFLSRNSLTILSPTMFMCIYFIFWGPESCPAPQLELEAIGDGCKKDTFLLQLGNEATTAERNRVSGCFPPVLLQTATPQVCPYTHSDNVCSPKVTFFEQANKPSYRGASDLNSGKSERKSKQTDKI